MDTVVLKFGATSVQDAVALRRLVAIVSAETRRRVVVVSALARVADTLADVASGKLRGTAAGTAMHRLLERHLAVVRELVAPYMQATLVARLRRRFEEATSFDLSSPGGRDALRAIGELASSDVVAAVLAAAGVPATWIDAHDVIVTDDGFGQAKPVHASIRAAACRLLQPLLAAGRVPVLAGGVGVGPDGATTSLGRYGSDMSTALVAGAVNAQEIQLWTDGVLLRGQTPVTSRLNPFARAITGV